MEVYVHPTTIGVLLVLKQALPDNYPVSLSPALLLSTRLFGVAVDLRSIDHAIHAPAVSKVQTSEVP